MFFFSNHYLALLSIHAAIKKYSTLNVKLNRLYLLKSFGSNTFCNLMLSHIMTAISRSIAARKI